MTLFLGLLFGSVGGVYLFLARREHSIEYLICGFVLVIYPYFLSNPLLIILVYSFLKAAPYGGVEWRFSTDAYLNFLFQRDIFDDTLQFTPDFLIISSCPVFDDPDPACGLTNSEPATAKQS